MEEAKLSLEEVNDKIEKVLNEYDELKYQKIKLEHDKCFASFKDGGYYKYRANQCREIFFRFSKENVHVMGASPENVVIHECLERFSTRMTTLVTYASCMIMDVNDFTSPSDFEEISKEKFVRDIENAKNHLDNLVNC